MDLILKFIGGGLLIGIFLGAAIGYFWKNDPVVGAIIGTFIGGASGLVAVLVLIWQGLSRLH